jgi:hypothetical protein
VRERGRACVPTRPRGEVRARTCTGVVSKSESEQERERERERERRRGDSSLSLLGEGAVYR